MCCEALVCKKYFNNYANLWTEKLNEDFEDFVQLQQ